MIIYNKEYISFLNFVTFIIYFLIKAIKNFKAFLLLNAVLGFIILIFEGIFLNLDNLKGSLLIGTYSSSFFLLEDLLISAFLTFNGETDFI